MNGSSSVISARKSILTVAACVIAASALICPPPVKADIYLYRDKEGIYHFTDQPLSPHYRLFIRQWRPPSSPSAETSSTYERYINEASHRYKIDSHLLQAVVKVESNFNPRAVSSKGAMGLMQIMPHNFSLLGIRDPFNPQENILGGARYLREMLNRFDDLPLALAAYNAGPGAVDRYKAIPPFNETQDYVKRVLHYYNTLKNGTENQR